MIEDRIIHKDAIISSKKPDIEIMFNSGKTLEVNSCKPSYDEHTISFIGEEEIFIIPYGSIEYIRIQNKQTVKET